MLANKNLINEALIFNAPNASPEQIQNVGFKIIVAMYIGKQNNNVDLNKLRFLCFKKGCNNKNFHLSMLPPTKSAAAAHSFRTYLQVQQWLGNELDPKDWGWELQNNGLEPIQTTDPLLPENLLKNISCSCAKDCTKACSCVKHGLKCSEYCANCVGETCKNAPQPKTSSDNIEFDNDDDDEAIDLEIEIAKMESFNTVQIEDEDEDQIVENFDEEERINPLKRRKIN